MSNSIHFVSSSSATGGIQPGIRVPTTPHIRQTKTPRDGRGFCILCRSNVPAKLPPEQREQQDDGQRNAQKPKKRAFAKSHDASPQSVLRRAKETHKRRSGSQNETPRNRAASSPPNRRRLKRSSGLRTCQASGRRKGSPPARSPQARPAPVSGRPSRARRCRQCG